MAFLRDSMASEGTYRDLASSSSTTGATVPDISSGRGLALVAFCLAFRGSSFFLGSSASPIIGSRLGPKLVLQHKRTSNHYGIRCRSLHPQPFCHLR